MKHWETIADDLSKAGWELRLYFKYGSKGGRQFWIADAHRGDGKRFIVRADEKLTAFLELEARPEWAEQGGNCKTAEMFEVCLAHFLCDDIFGAARFDLRAANAVVLSVRRTKRIRADRTADKPCLRGRKGCGGARRVCL